MSIIVYRYGLLAPTFNADLVEDQLRRANTYWNALVEIERARRDIVREVYGQRDEALGEPTRIVNEIKVRLDEAYDEVKAHRAATRSRKVPAEMMAVVKGIKDELAGAREVQKAARAAQQLTDVERERLREAEEDAKKRGKEARAASGCYWGTYLLVEAAMDQSRKQGLWRWSQRDKCTVPNNPRFRRFGANGVKMALGVQIQISAPLTAEGALACVDTRFQVALEPQPEKMSKTRRGKRFGVVKIRVGSEGKGNRIPVWAEFPVLLHRPLPQGACIKWVKAVCEPIGDRRRWELHLSLEVSDDRRVFGKHGKPEKRGDGAVFVNFGWREKPEGRRCAYWRDDDGAEGEVLVDPAVIGGLRKVSDLVSIRKQALNDMSARLLEWVSDDPSAQSPPEWFAERTATMAQWKGAGKFVGLLEHWDKNRWSGDDVGYAILSDWQLGVFVPELGRRDGGNRHLWQWENDQRETSLRRREDHYRRVAAGLARRYAVLVVEKWDMSETKRRKPPGEDQGEVQAAKRALQETATGELRQCMVQAFVARGGRVVEVDAHLDTQRCAEVLDDGSVCGCEERWDASPRIMHACEACGRSWDQDANNVRNIERKFRERSDDGEEPTTKPQAKWAQRGRHKGTARKHGANGARSLES